MIDDDWYHRAICVGMDVEFFFPERGAATNEIKRLCQMCPVSKPCLEFAIKRSERFGIWGGCSERERRKMRAARVRYNRGEDRTLSLSECFVRFGIPVSLVPEKDLAPFSGVGFYK